MQLGIRGYDRIEADKYENVNVNANINIEHGLPMYNDVKFEEQG
jgi:hypothetical protein